MAENTSSFQEHIFKTEALQISFTIRVLKMLDSILIHICNSENEVLDEMAVAMPFKTGETVGTTVIGSTLDCGSKELALKLSEKLNKQVYVSYNASISKLFRLKLEKRLIDEINKNPQFF